MAGVGVAVKSMWRSRTQRFRKAEETGAIDTELNSDGSELVDKATIDNT